MEGNSKNDDGKKENKKDGYFDVDTIAEKLGIPLWEVAGIMRLRGWKSGKSVTKKEVDEARRELKNRSVGTMHN